jgi:regulatory protein
VNKKSKQDFNHALQYAFRLLKFRLRSEKEIITRLTRRGYSTATIEKVVRFLKQSSFLSDEEFAKIWTESRLKRPFGLRRIRQELKDKGVKEDLVEACLSQVKANYCEQETVLRLARQRLSRLKDPSSFKTKARLYNYLLRRGFSADTVYEVVVKLLK